MNKLARLTLYHEYQYIYQFYIETKDKKGMIKIKKEKKCFCLTEKPVFEKRKSLT